MPSQSCPLAQFMNEQGSEAPHWPAAPGQLAPRPRWPTVHLIPSTPGLQGPERSTLHRLSGAPARLSSSRVAPFDDTPSISSCAGVCWDQLPNKTPAPKSWLRQPSSADGKQMPAAPCVWVSQVPTPTGPGTAHALQAMGERPEQHRALRERRGQAWGRGQGQNAHPGTSPLPLASDGFAFSLLRFQLFPKALPTTVVAVIVSSLFDPLTGTQIHRLAAR